MSTTKTRDLLGSGLSFPPRPGPDGRLAWSSGEANVRECIRVLLLTEPGERVMREQYGCGLRQYLFEPNTPTTRELIRQQITDAINRWEPRVRVQQVTVTQDPDDAHTAAVNVRFRLVATGVALQLGMSLTLQV
jgi:phage baseplate assembly protein W